MHRAKESCEQIIVFGAGGHSRVVIDALEACGTAPEAVYDDNHQLWSKDICGYKVLGGIDALADRANDNVTIIVGVALNDVRFKLVNKLSAMGFRLRGVRHPSAIVSKSAVISESAQLLAGAIVNPGTHVGEHTIINTGAVVEHDSYLGGFVHIGPGAVLAGGVRILEGAFVCTGASVIPSKKIGAWAVVGGGSVVIDDVPDGVEVVGVPARQISKG
jgi:acetyltransferase EpsM